MKNAFVTLITNDGFATGALALVNSLRLTGTKADIVVMHTGGVSDVALAPFRDKSRLVLVDLLDTSAEFNTRHARKTIHGDAPFTKGRKPDFHTPLDNFAKLRLWQLDYEIVVFMDADTVALRNIDRLFAYPEFSAAPNVYESVSDFHRLNSGIFVAKPSDATFADMMQRLDQPDKFWRRTDQTFLQDYFPDWHGLPVFFNMLQYVWFNMPTLWDWASISVIHYQYEKPWEAEHPRAVQLAPLIDIWHGFAEGHAPDLTALQNPT